MSLGTRLFVSNLPDSADENNLRNAFAEYGEVINLDLKLKSAAANEQKKFAFITLSASNHDVESCIKNFSNEDFKGNRLYVTRARESFLERLQREREQAQKKEAKKNDPLEKLPINNPVIKLSENLNPRKRKLESNQSNEVIRKTEVTKLFEKKKIVKPDFQPCHDGDINQTLSEQEKKKNDSEKKRMESMKKKRQEFKKQQMIIKTGLIDVDKVQNKKVIFSDNEDEFPVKLDGHVGKKQKHDKTNTLFECDDSGDEVNFEIKKQFEGKKGQKVLDLQSRYKSDKRFMLDERFIDDNHSEGEEEQKEGENHDEIDLSQTDEKAKQFNILQDVLGVSIKPKHNEQDNKKLKPKLGMLRFDPSQPEHAKFLMPVEEIKHESKKGKKKKDKKEERKEEIEMPESVVEKVEVSKEQFYKVSDTLKEAIAQPTTFSLRSLFANSEDIENGPQEQDADYIPLETPNKPKIKNPLDRGDRNPFVYDSSDSETEEVDKVEPEALPIPTEIKAVWKENLFFSKTDNRLTEGLVFFNKTSHMEGPKDRRELKSLMKKRIYNKERKNQMFQKKIGGRKKSMKKSYRKKT